MPPSGCERLAIALGARCMDVLHTRGLLALRLPRPIEQDELALRWYTDPPDTTRGDLIWYTVGSMRYGPTWELRRTGCAVVVVTASDDLVAFGNAVPPSWVRTAAATELWTLLLVLTASVVRRDGSGDGEAHNHHGGYGYNGQCGDEVVSSGGHDQPGGDRHNGDERGHGPG